MVRPSPIYDLHGRPIHQTRTIDGRTYTMTTDAFDPLNRPTAVTYPNGETVTMAYDGRLPYQINVGVTAVPTPTAHLALRPSRPYPSISYEWFVVRKRPFSLPVVIDVVGNGRTHSPQHI